MLFSSLEFLYLFLPVSLGLYFLCPKRLRNALLLVLSLIFYAFGEPIYLFLMMFTVIMDFIFALMIEKAIAPRQKRFILILAILFNLSLLFFFKYFSTVATLFGFSAPDIALPLGISFYTFQALSYVIDVYRNQTSASRNLIDFGAYVSLFPQLIAGPIVRYTDVEAELKRRTNSITKISSGLTTFSAGLAKKVLFANSAGALAATLLEKNESVASLWLGLIAYAFQIYYDFSGYSDMAIGLGRILGFSFPENFNYPYVCESITDFWRRWHITLSSWFREYVYIPLGGNRRGKLRTYVNLFVVWSLTGLWHGAGFNFLLWGLYFFVILVLEKAFLLKILKALPHMIRLTYALVLILVGWFIFYSDGASATDIFTRIISLFGFGGIPFTSENIGYVLLSNLPMLVLMAVGATPFPKSVLGKLKALCPTAEGVLRTSLTILSFVVSTAYLVDNGFNPFLYFRF